MNPGWPTKEQPHLYRVRLVKGAAWSAVKVWYGQPLDPLTSELLDRSPRWQVEVNGTLINEPFDLVMLIDGQAPIVKGERIDEVEYRYLLKTHSWAREYEPDAPEANPRKRINLNELRPLF